jgi:hypothetical protein
MDCDDEIGLVKRDDDPHAHGPDFSRVAGIPAPISIDVNGMRDDPFCIGNAEAMPTSPVLGMSREAHAQSRSWRPKLSPLDAGLFEDGALDCA